MVSGESKEKSVKRLKIIEGQVRGLQKLVSEDTYCLSVLQQISAVHEALRSVGKVIVRHYLETCATDGLRGLTPGRYHNEIMDIVYKLSK